MDSDMSSELKFRDLSARHYGLTDAVSSGYAEAATVCLERHHKSVVQFEVSDNKAVSQASAAWDPVDEGRANSRCTECCFNRCARRVKSARLVELAASAGALRSDEATFLSGA